LNRNRGAPYPTPLLSTITLIFSLLPTIYSSKCFLTHHILYFPLDRCSDIVLKIPRCHLRLPNHLIFIGVTKLPDFERFLRIFHEENLVGVYKVKPNLGYRGTESHGSEYRQTGCLVIVGNSAFLFINK